MLDHGRHWLIEASEQGDEENSHNCCKEGVLAELKSVRGGVFRMMNDIHPSSQGKMTVWQSLMAASHQSGGVKQAVYYINL